MNRSFIYHRIKKGYIDGRPFRTWTPRGDRSSGPTCWPYLNQTEEGYTDLLCRVNDAVPRSWPDYIRADVCQDIVVAILSGEISERDIALHTRSFIRRHFKMFPVKDFQTVSLDAPLRASNGDRTEKRLIDTIESESYYEAIGARPYYGQSLADCETTEDFAERLEDAWESNRLSRDQKTCVRFDRPDGTAYADPDYYHYRRKYQVVNKKVRSQEVHRDSFGGAWSLETALPEECRPVE